MRIGLATVFLTIWPITASAVELSLPGDASLTREIVREKESYRVPVAPFSDGAIPTLEVEGSLVQQAWRLEAQAITTLQMLSPLRDQLSEAGYDILLDCVGQECGGFDFRFATRVMPAPDMFVDLFDYRFLSARKGATLDSLQYVSVIVSRSGSTGYIQIIHVAPQGSTDLNIATDAGLTFTAPPEQSDRPIAEALQSVGHVILPDLFFESGSAELGPGPFESLAALAAYLKADATLRVALVGHTDTVGDLAPNIALSKMRANSVLERLVTAYDVPREQLAAEGMGYLAPIAPNVSRQGREANRRVEAVLLNTE